MRRHLPVSCDRCGRPISAIADAVVAQVYDELGRCIELSLNHAACAAVRRQELEGDATLVDVPAADLQQEDRVDGLRTLARASWASATRIIRRVERLRLVQPRGSVDAAPPVTRDVRQRPLFRGSR